MLNAYVYPGFGYFETEVENRPPELSFNLKDNRCDPLVTVALKAMERALSALKFKEFSLETAIYTVTDTGCQSHILRVVDALKSMRPRQAFFARGSAVMFSTYGSMAIGSHGPCISITGRGAALAQALNLARNFCEESDCHRAVLLCADEFGGVMSASAAYFTSEDIHKMNVLIKFGMEDQNVDLCAGLILNSYFSS
ncbi:hypothetical protein CFN58_05770 [Pseudomonas avellanae]|uniref:Beta-ketoacyl synthase N-terminal domain-containing protein n=2 Tax=Pseudomonas syringae group TaxID=136849 RepID=A0A261WMG2_9PSED|nr:hypothetical protein [Pseudomonas syringae]ATV20675.1 hypothetical protein CT122_30860 [Pseudomonas syringae pv. actinidiae]OZI87152.1 hypothetical protein CFN58_05770 [Pseudomonas avellanae]PIN57826.1 hypothetical protein CUB86_31220 [Pseudomonas syringae pv. actinidiae]GAO97351.1 hypothetical protein PSA5_31550 [Pseudomonas syringae pv. actinidiae]